MPDGREDTKQRLSRRKSLWVVIAVLTLAGSKSSETYDAQI